MKKIISIMTAFIITNSFAQPLMCPFTDHFYIDAPLGYGVKSLLLDGNITGNIVDPLHFILSCRSDTTTANGTAYVVIRDTVNNACNLTIVDGPYEKNPKLLGNCTGNLRFTGVDHAWGTYTYKLKFTPQMNTAS